MVFRMARITEMRSTGTGSGLLRSDGDEKELTEKMTDSERIHALVATCSPAFLSARS